MSAKAVQTRRQDTENRILDAFERVLCDQGIGNLTLNAVVEQANVGKPLIYRYFGGLSGLVTAWGERRGAFPDPRPPEETGRETADDLRYLLESDLLRTADHLKKNPVTLEFLAEELVGKTDLSKAFQAVRRKTRRANTRRLMHNAEYAEPENRALILLLYAAISYLALRSRHAADYFDLQLDTDDGWEQVKSMVSIVIRNTRQNPGAAN